MYSDTNIRFTGKAVKGHAMVSAVSPPPLNWKRTSVLKSFRRFSRIGTGFLYITLFPKRDLKTYKGLLGIEKSDFLRGILDFVCKSKFSIAVRHPLPLSIKTAAVKKVEKNLHFKFSKKTSELFFRGPLFQCFLPIIHVWPRLQQSKTHTLKRVLWSFGNANRPVS